MLATNTSKQAALCNVVTLQAASLLPWMRHTHVVTRLPRLHHILREVADRLGHKVVDLLHASHGVLDYDDALAGACCKPILLCHTAAGRTVGLADFRRSDTLAPVRSPPTAQVRDHLQEWVWHNVVPRDELHQPLTIRLQKYARSVNIADCHRATSLKAGYAWIVPTCHAR